MLFVSYKVKLQNHNLLGRGSKSYFWCLSGFSLSHVLVRIQDGSEVICLNVPKWLLAFKGAWRQLCPPLPFSNWTPSEVSVGKIPAVQGSQNPHLENAFSLLLSPFFQVWRCWISWYFCFVWLKSAKSQSQKHLILKCHVPAGYQLMPPLSLIMTVTLLWPTVINVCLQTPNTTVCVRRFCYLVRILVICDSSDAICDVMWYVMLFVILVNCHDNWVRDKWFTESPCSTWGIVVRHTDR